MLEVQDVFTRFDKGLDSLSGIVKPEEGAGIFHPFWNSCDQVEILLYSQFSGLGFSQHNPKRIRTSGEIYRT